MEEVKVCSYCKKIISDSFFVKCHEKVKVGNKLVEKATGYMHTLCADHLLDMVEGFDEER